MGWSTRTTWQLESSTIRTAQHQQQQLGGAAAGKGGEEEESSSLSSSSTLSSSSSSLPASWLLLMNKNNDNDENDNNIHTSATTSSQQPQSISSSSPTPPPAAAAAAGGGVDDNDTVGDNDTVDKPYFVIHIGPPKTGTTTLQEELTAAQKDGWLKLDNFLYTGQYVYADRKSSGKRGSSSGSSSSSSSSSSSIPFVKSLLSQRCHVQLQQQQRRLKILQKQQQRRQQQRATNNNTTRRKMTSSKSSTSLASSSVVRLLRQVDCWKDAWTVLESYRLNKTSIIHSDETYGYKSWRYWNDDDETSATMSSSDPQKSATNNTTTTTTTATTRSAAALRKKNVIVGPWDWTLLQETLHDAGWKVVVVVGYRRYAEWIMSVKQHAEKWTGRKPRHAQWPKTSTTTTATVSTPASSTITKPHKNHQNNASSSTSDAGDGILFAPPFPTILTIRSGRDELWKPYYPFYDVNFILESLRQQQKQQENNNAMMMDVRILNLHEATTVQQATSSVRTTFLCHVLQNAAPHACRKSRAMDRRYAQTAAATPALNGTQQTTMQRRRANAAKNAQSVMYDVLATTAAARGMVNIHRHSRRQVVEYCRAFHEMTLQNKVLPFHCPTREQLQSLLDLSLQKESDVFQKLVVDSSSTTTTTTTGTQQQHPQSLLLLPPPPVASKTTQHHVDSFWTAATLPNRTNKYCWIDAPAVLQTKEWQDIFAMLLAPAQ
jgi:hypothetical protein